jgi:hypothetical protein
MISAWKGFRVQFEEFNCMNSLIKVSSRCSRVRKGLGKLYMADRDDGQAKLWGVM